MLRQPQFGRVLLATILGTVLMCAPTAKAESNRVILVEEHWTLELGEPDPDVSAPQTTMVMSPTANLNGVHFLFTLNHAAAPDYQPGGMQVQTWDGADLVEESVGNEEGSLQGENEVVHWVQRITLNDSTLTFEVRDGESETWNSFGGDDLTLHTETSLASLNGYRPAVSLAESQVNYAENRVGSLTLTKLVWMTEDGQVHELNAPISVDTSLDE
jgi:hypothetical protein